jgi:hypothetical protein
MSGHRPTAIEVRSGEFRLTFATTEEAKLSFEDGVLKGFYLQMPNPFTVVIKYGKALQSPLPSTLPYD